jgi:3-carboxymethyl-3-hydroxy-acyl-[acp] synthase
LADRYRLDMTAYELLCKLSQDAAFGVRDQRFDAGTYANVYELALDGRGLLVLDEIRDFHRTYRWS